MNDTQITLQGWLGGPVTVRQAGGSPVATFRVASTPRHFSRKSEQWVDGETQWYTVTAWRGLADHCARSLHRGDPVVVGGRLQSRSYLNPHGVEVTDLEVEAVSSATTSTAAPRRSPGRPAASRSDRSRRPGARRTSRPTWRSPGERRRCGRARPAD